MAKFYAQDANGNSAVLSISLQNFTQSLSQNGWCKLPNGLILQWVELHGINLYYINIKEDSQIGIDLGNHLPISVNKICQVAFISRNNVVGEIYCPVLSDFDNYYNTKMIVNLIGYEGYHAIFDWVTPDYSIWGNIFFLCI